MLRAGINPGATAPEPPVSLSLSGHSCAKVRFAHNDAEIGAIECDGLRQAGTSEKWPERDFESEGRRCDPCQAHHSLG